MAGRLAGTADAHSGPVPIPAAVLLQVAGDPSKGGGRNFLFCGLFHDALYTYHVWVGIAGDSGL